MLKYLYILIIVCCCAACSPIREKNSVKHFTEVDTLDIASDPEATKTIAPMYPLVLANNGVIGYTCFLFDIPLTGIPNNIRIYDSVPLGAFDQVALAAFKGWRFKVHKSGDIAVEAKDKKYCLDFKL